MATTAPSTPGRWLFGPVPDLLFGCGLLYVGLCITALFAGPSLRAAQPALLFPAAVLLLSMPHYGATLVRVYEQRESRRAYVFFSVWATAAVALAFVAGTRSTLVASALLTLYLTWSPWHYTGQNYGLAVMFLGRAGVALPPATKRLLYASFLLSYALTFLVMHSADGVVNYGTDGGGPLVQFAFVPLGIGEVWLRGLVPLLATAYVVTLAAAFVRLSRGNRAADLLPAAALALTQALWFTLPFGMRFLALRTGIEPIDWSFRGYYLYWIVLGHAVQYLWVTAYYARKSGQWTGALPYAGKTLAAGVALWTLPIVAFAPGRLGDLGYHAGLGLLLASAINIHHFILDGAIWKLRSGRIASVLIRSRPEDGAAAPERAGRRWARTATWAVATAGLFIAVQVFVEEAFVYPRALRERNYEAAHSALDRLEWYGRGNFFLRKQTPRE
jgi:hypothetical protein